MTHISQHSMADFLLDFGPGDGLSRLSYSSLGFWDQLISLCASHGQERLFTIGSTSSERLVLQIFAHSCIQSKW